MGSAYESNELVPIYMSAALLLYFKKDLLQKVNSKGDALQDLHVFFAEIKWEKINFDKIIQISEELFDKYPPSLISPVEVATFNPLSVEIYDNEIKENALMNDGDSSSDYNSEFITPLVDISEEADFPDIDTNDVDEDDDDDDEVEKKKIMENNDKYKPKAIKVKKNKNLKNINLKIDINLKFEEYFDEFVSLFDRKYKKKTRKRYTTVTIEHLFIIFLFNARHFV